MTSDDNASPFAERLIQIEPGDAALRRRYEEEKLALRERQLTPAQKAMGWLAMPVYAWLGLGLGYRLLASDVALPREWLVLEGVSVLGVLALGAWMLRVLLQKGRVTWRDDQLMMWIGGGGLCALAFALFQVARSLDDSRAALGLLGCAGVLLLGGACSLILQWIRRLRLETQVKMLELELRADDLAREVADARRPHAD